MISMKDNLHPKFINDIKIVFWTGYGEQEMECQIESITETQITLLTNGLLPKIGQSGSIWRPFFPLFSAVVSDSDNQTFTAKFTEIDILDEFRIQAKTMLELMVKCEKTGEKITNYTRPYRLLERMMIKLVIILERGMTDIHKRVFKKEDFSWSTAFENEWQKIQSEIKTVFSKVNVSDIPQGPDNIENWNSVHIAQSGKLTEGARQHFPVTTRLVENIPGLINANFSILRPGAELGYHKADFRFFLRMHLGVIIPDGDVRLKLEDQSLQWKDGEVMIFDDFFPHSAWNKTEYTRVVLLIDFFRPMPYWKKLIVLGLMKIHSASNQKSSLDWI